MDLKVNTATESACQPLRKRHTTARTAVRVLAFILRFLVGGIFTVAILTVVAMVFLPPESREQLWTGIAIWTIGMLLGLLDAIRSLRR